MVPAWGDNLLRISGFSVQTISFGPPTFEVVKYVFLQDRVQKMPVNIQPWTTRWPDVAV